MRLTLLRRIKHAVSALCTGVGQLVRQHQSALPNTSSTETPAEPSTTEPTAEPTPPADPAIEQSAHTDIVTYRLCYRGFNEVGWRTATTFDPTGVTEDTLLSALESLETIDPPPGHYALFPIDGTKRMRPAIWRTEIQGDMEAWQQRYDRERLREKYRRAREHLQQMPSEVGLALPDSPAAEDDWADLIALPDDDQSTASLDHATICVDSTETTTSSDPLDVFRE